ncbi:hypothetical protein ABZ642_04815 [Streptomyces sp. NPDC007157]|uniref:hypothetical protein n=1 Tax=Streptomyces sp. NPDC007157 TaxID=3154681 RepID=UPI0033F0AD2A
MEQDTTRIAQVRLPDGTSVWAWRAGPPAVPSGRPSFPDAGPVERFEARRAVPPGEVGIGFRAGPTAKAGKADRVAGPLAVGEAKAATTVPPTWNGGRPPDPDDAGHDRSPGPPADASGGAPVSGDEQAVGAEGGE